MARNPNSKQGPFLEPPAKKLLVKSATGYTHVNNGTRPLEHYDSPLTPSTNGENFGVSPRHPRGGPIE